MIGAVLRSADATARRDGGALTGDRRNRPHVGNLPSDNAPLGRGEAKTRLTMTTLTMMRALEDSERLARDIMRFAALISLAPLAARSVGGGL